MASFKPAQLHSEREPTIVNTDFKDIFRVKHKPKSKYTLTITSSVKVTPFEVAAFSYISVIVIT